MLYFCLFAALLLIFLGGLYYCYRLTFYYRDPMRDPRQYHRDDQNSPLEERLEQAISAFLSAPFEDVAITSRDGLRLTGRYFHAEDGAPLLIQCHGYKGDAIRDFCGAWPLAQELRYNVLLIDERAHRTSEGHTITFGILEHQDCLEWVKYACGRFGSVPVFLMGVSMGAATVLMASSQPLPDNVKGVIADCPYDAPANIIKKVMQTDLKLPVRLLYPLVRMGGKLFGRFDLESHSPMASVRNARVPILLIHGDADRFVPYEMSCKLAQAAPEQIEFHTVPHAGHALNQVTAPELYRDIVINFIRKQLSARRRS